MDGDLVFGGDGAAAAIGIPWGYLLWRTYATTVFIGFIVLVLVFIVAVGLNNLMGRFAERR